MDKAKLLSNEPLRILSSHVQELKKICKHEQTKNKKLKSCLVRLKEVISHGVSQKEINEINTIIDHALPSVRSLNSSYQIITDSKYAAPLILKLQNICEARLKLIFEISKFRKHEESQKFRLFHKNSGRKHRTSKSFQEISNVQCPTEGLNKIELVLKKRMIIYFNGVVIKREQDEVAMGCNNKILAVEDLNPIYETAISDSSGILLRVKGFKSLRNLLSKSRESDGRLILDKIKYYYEYILIIEQGVQSISDLLGPKLRNSKKEFMVQLKKTQIKKTINPKLLSIFTSYLGAVVEKLLEKTKSQVFSLLLRSYSNANYKKSKKIEALFLEKIHKILEISTCKSFQSLVYPEKDGKQVHSQAKFSKKLYRISFLLEKTLQIFKKNIFKRIFVKHIHIYSNYQKVLVPLSISHHKLSETLINLSNLPAIIQNNHLKSSFLQIVSYVTHEIGHNTVIQDSLQRLLQIFKLYQSKRTQKSLYTWKNSSFPKSKLNKPSQLCTRPLLNLISAKLKPLFSKIKQSSTNVRKSIINVKVILDQQNLLKKSQFFNKWQETISNLTASDIIHLSPPLFSTIKENLYLSPIQGQKFLQSAPSSSIYHKPLQLLKYN